MEELFAVQDKASDYRYPGFGCFPKRKSYAIQAADLLAWQWYKDKKNQSEGRPRRKDCESLLQLHHNAGHLDRSSLTTMLQNAPVMSRIVRAGPLMPLPAGLFRELQ